MSDSWASRRRRVTLAHCIGPPISALPTPRVELLVSDALGRVHRHDADRAHRQIRFVLARQQPGDAFADPRAHGGHRAGERQNHASARRERVEPAVQRMGHSGVDEYRVERSIERTRRIPVTHIHPGHRRQIPPRLIGQVLVDLEGDDTARGSDRMGHHRRVVTESAADVQDAGARRRASSASIHTASVPGWPLNKLRAPDRSQSPML